MENRLIFQNAPEAPRQQAAEDPVAKIAKEGFKNPDGSYYDPEKSLYVSGKDSAGNEIGSLMSPEDAILYKKDDLAPFVDVKPEIAKSAGKVETKQETEAQLVEVKTQMDLEALKNKMAQDFDALMAAISLDGKSISGKSVVLTATFGTIGLDEKEFNKEVLKLLDLGKLEIFIEKLRKASDLNIKKEDADDLLALIYANSIVVKTRSAFSTRYPRCKEFVEGVDLAKTKMPAFDFPYEVKFGKGVDFDVVLKVENNEFDKAYSEYVTKNPQAQEAPKPPSAQEENLKARVKVLQDSFAGKALAWMGLVKLEKVEEGETPQAKAEREKRNYDAYAAALNGENTFAKWVVWLLGGGAMLDGGGEDIAASIKDMDPKHAALIAGLQEQAKALPFSLEKAAQKVKPLEGAAGEGLDIVDKEKFGEIVADNKKMPEKGLKLNGAFEFGTQKLILNLKGAEMILSKGSSVRKADGNLETASYADKSFKDTELVLIGQLPAGVVFKGKPVLKLEKMGA